MLNIQHVIIGIMILKVKIIKNKYLKRELIVLAKNSNIKKFNYKRANACAVAASQQSGRISVPKIHEFKSLKSILSSWNKKDKIILVCKRSDPRL